MNTKLATIKPEQMQMIMDQAKNLHTNEGLDKSSAIIMATLGQLLGNTYTGNVESVESIIKGIYTIVDAD